MEFVSCLVDLFISLCGLDLFIVFVSAYGVAALWMLASHFVAGKRVFYK